MTLFTLFVFVPSKHEKRDNRAEYSFRYFNFTKYSLFSTTKLIRMEKIILSMITLI